MADFTCAELSPTIFLSRAAAMYADRVAILDRDLHHPEGCFEIKDRSKDIIITGGENVASVGVERVIDANPDVVESALVGRFDAKRGEVPVAFVTVRPGAILGAEDVVSHGRKHLAGFKVPRQVHFVALPKTSTGKIQKQSLRDADPPLPGT